MKKSYLKLVFLTLFTSAASAQVYVTPTGAGSKDGSSWANAFDGTQLQQAINVSAGGSQVWVAKGTYKPTQSLSTTGFLTDGTTAVTNRDNTFLLKAGVAIYGGFDGTEAFGSAAIAARNFATNETILSGDLNSNNLADDGDSYHVVASVNAALNSILDGFTIKHGFANGTASVTVGAEVIAQNFSAGIFVNSDQAGLRLSNLLIKLNKSAGSAGAIYLRGINGNVAIDKCAFKDNSAVTAGHIYILDGKATIKNTTFENGTASGNGGAMFIASAVTGMDISKSKFYANTANGTTGGGAIYSSTTIKISKTDFRSNTTASWGGALYLHSTATAASEHELSNCFFYNNVGNGIGTANQGGGALYVTYNTATTTLLTAINNTFYANQSPNSPNGAISFNADPKLTLKLYNNIFNGNQGNVGGVMVSADLRRRSDPISDFQNNLFQVTPVESSSDDTYTLNIINDAPASLFQSVTATDYNFLYPTSNSVVNEKGNNALYATVGNINTDTHLAGYARLAGTFIDMGAVEYASILPVTIKSFTAKLVNNRTQLNWTVGTEDNVNHYEIERSQNGVDFVKVAETKATLANSYNVTDANPQIGLNYYRLKTVDNDGKFSYYGSLQTVKVNALAAASTKVYPNPVKGNVINVSMSGYPVGTYQAKLVSTAGATLQQNLVNYDGSKGISFTTNAPAGLYILHLMNGDVKVTTKVIKQ